MATRKKTKKEQTDNAEFFAALRIMGEEKGIPDTYLAEKIANAIVVALRKDYGNDDAVSCIIDCEKEIFTVTVAKTVVEEVLDPSVELTVEQAAEFKKDAAVGDVIDVKLEPKKFGRIVAQTAKHVIRQGIRDVERDQTLAEFQSKTHELVTAVVQRIDPRTGNASLTIGKAEATLPKIEQVPDEVLEEGDHIRVYIVDVKDTEKGPRAMLSRTHPGLVKRLFELEVPEIYDGTIEIRAVSRQAGSRTKLAVWSADENIDAIGACIGPRGERVNQIVEELNGEKIDVVRYNDDPTLFIAEALSPAKVETVEIESEDPKVCHVTVPDDQLSLAIGNKGQNVRLAARLTGWKIDIRPKSGFFTPGSDILGE